MQEQGLGKVIVEGENVIKTVTVWRIQIERKEGGVEKSETEEEWDGVDGGDGGKVEGKDEREEERTRVDFIIK